VSWSGIPFQAFVAEGFSLGVMIFAAVLASPGAT
jgi:hypothetical protein